MNFDFNNYQQLLFPYAYNILGSVEDAKDTIQDVMSNYLAIYQKREIHNLKGYLVKGVVNQAINLKNRQSKIVNEQVLLPEPITTENAETPVYLESIASYGMLILLDKLNVKERAVFMLKEVFHYSHQEIAEVLSANVENSRKILSRAKKKLKKATFPIHIPPNTLKQACIDKYVTAIRKRDVASLQQLFTEDIVLVADGGDKVQVVRNVTQGKQMVIDLLLLVFEKFLQAQTFRITEVNHQPAILYTHQESPTSCQIFSVNAQGKIDRVSAVVDPEKLIQLMS